MTTYLRKIHMLLYSNNIQKIYLTVFMTKNATLKQQKTRLRQTLKVARTNITKEQNIRKSHAITQQLLQLPTLKTANIIFIYISYANEVHTHDIINILFNTGKTLAVPKIINATDMHAVYMIDWGNMLTDHMGILTPPTNQRCEQHFDIAITPGLGFSASGQRIGYGRGYYDKWFSQHHVKHKIGLAFESQLIDSIPTESTDITMDIIVTEKRTITI